MPERNRTLALVAAACVALAFSARADERVTPETQPTAVAFAPVPGGMSDRLAVLGGSVKKTPAEFRQELTKVLEQARKDAHSLVDELVDSDQFDTWLAAMTEKAGNDFAQELRGKPSEQVRASLHSRLDRRLSKLGQEISQKLQSEDPERLQASFELALKDLAREEDNLVKASEQASEAPAAPEGSADAPSAPMMAYMTPGGVRTYNAYGYGRTAAYDRTLAVAQQRAWFQNQLAATRWNAQVNSFNTYLYGARHPAYASQRTMAYHCSRPFPAGYYYRPDRVERVVRRGLWGAAAVAATPFALVASLF